MNIIRLPRLSRGWKTARNLTFAVLWLVFLWGLMDYPLYDQMREFRRAEQIQWAGPSDIWRAGDHYNTVGTYLDQVIVQSASNYLQYWPRNPEGPTLVPLNRVYDGDFLAVDVPDGTAKAELTLELSFYYFSSDVEQSYIPTTYAVREHAEQDREEPTNFWQAVYVIQGEFQEKGGILFHAEPKGPFDPEGLNRLDELPLIEATDRDIYSQDPWDSGVRAKMEAIFYGANGQELGRAALATPEKNGAAN